MENDELLQQFVDEAAEHVENIEQGLLSIQQQKEPEHIRAIFRAVHSIKGTAGFFALDHIVTLAHAMENILGCLVEQRLAVTEELINLLLSSNDVLRIMVKDVMRSGNIDITAIVAKIHAFPTKKTITTSSKQNKTIPSPVNDLRPICELMSCNSAAVDNNPEIKNATHMEDSIRVNVNVLNDLLTLVNEMVLGRNQLLRYHVIHRKNMDHSLKDLIQNVDTITTELQEKVMQTRLQPITIVFNKFPRVVHDLSNRLGKEVQLAIEGKDVELDKSIIEALGDPLTHLVRNAIDHGIESADERRKLGKPAHGNITLRAYHEGSMVNIEVSDDGKGINRNKILQSALNKGLIQSTDEHYNERDWVDLIWLPGFSTASSVSDISGRGVGLDVVKTNVDALGGSIEVLTKINEGTTFRLTLPLTLAIVPSLIVSLDGQNFAIPQVNLQEIVVVKNNSFFKKQSRKIEHVYNVPVLRLRGKLLPLLSLSYVLGLNGTVDEDYSSKPKVTIVVIKINNKRFGLIIDAVCDWEEILVKPLPYGIKDCRCYSGVTILGDGSVALILDPVGIAELGKLQFVEQQLQQADCNEDAGNMVEKFETLLLFSCLGSEIFGLDLVQIARVQKITPQQIELIGNRQYVHLGKRVIRLISLDPLLPGSTTPSPNSPRYVLLSKYSSNTGFLIGRIYNTVSVSIDTEWSVVDEAPDFQSAIVDGRIILRIDSRQLLPSQEIDRVANQ